MTKDLPLQSDDRREPNDSILVFVVRDTSVVSARRIWLWFVVLAALPAGCDHDLDQATILRAPPEAGFSVVLPVGRDQAVAIARQALTEVELSPETVVPGPPTTLVSSVGSDLTSHGQWVRVRVESIGPEQTRVACYARRVRVNNFAEDHPPSVQANVLYHVLAGTFEVLQRSGPVTENRP
jgi:hypothetical protein